mgnify:CR=1 FL=1
MGPSKLEKAEKLGIRIVNEEEFLGMIGRIKCHSFTKLFIKGQKND